MHALVRHVGGELHPFEIGFFRNLFGFVAVLPLAVRGGRQVLVSAQPRLQLLRGAVGVVALMTWFYALSIVPIAEATALSFTASVFAAIGAVVFLGETMGIRRWAAVGLGFAGMIVILRPGVSAVSPGALLVLLSAVCWGSGVVIVKRLSRTDSTVTIVTWMAAMMVVLSSVPALWVWETPTLVQLGWLAAIGALGTIGMLSFTQALKMVDATTILPLDFARLVWASLIGLWAFGERPDAATWVGGAIIVASTSYIAWREARLRILSESR